MTDLNVPKRTPIPAVYMRGGTSKGVFFIEDDLPPRGTGRDNFLLSMMGSPDPFGRQLNGMGGGISSLSKVIIARKSCDDNADVEYLHGQVAIDAPAVDYSANCGNLSSAVAQFAAEAGLVHVPAEGAAIVRMKNLNANILVQSRFAMSSGKPVYDGNFRIPGVFDPCAKVSPEYILPNRPLFRSVRQSIKLMLTDGCSPPAWQMPPFLAFSSMPQKWVR